MTGAGVITTLPLAAIAETSDGLTWSLTFIKRPFRAPMMELTVRGGRLSNQGPVNETAELTREQLAASIRDLCAAVGLAVSSSRPQAPPPSAPSAELSAEPVAVAPVVERPRRERPPPSKYGPPRRAPDAPPTQGSVEASILELLTADPGEAFDRTDIAEFCGKSPNGLGSVLHALVRRGVIQRIRHGRYQLAPKTKGKR
ncbi:MAG: type IV toxin-antitoxin system AbiEi family antitoxin domain-containing protein [bacterium]